MHGFDLGDELHRAHQVLGHQLLAARHVGRVRPRGGVGIHRHRGALPGRGLDQVRQRLLRRLHQAAVEGRSDRDLLRLDAGRSQLAHRRLHRRTRAGDDALQRRVVVGDDDAVDVGDGVLDVLAQRRHRGHRAQLGTAGLGSVDDEAATGSRQLHQRVEVDRAGRVLCDELAVAVPGQHLGLQPQALHQAQQAHGHRTQRRLRDVGLCQRLARGGLVVVAVGAAREHELGQRLVEALPERRCQRLVGRRQRVGHHREQQRQFARHAGVLRTLPREQHRQLAAQRRAAAVEHARRRQLGFAAQEGLRCRELAREVVAAAGHDGQALFADMPALGQAGRDVAQRQARRGNQRRLQRAQARQQLRAVGRCPHQQLGRPVLARGALQPGPVLAGVLLHHDVEVGAAETERAAGGAARCAAVQPGHGLVHQVQRRVGHGQGLVGVLHAQVRRQHLVVQRQHGLHHAGDAGRGLGVADHRLHRADDGAARRPAFFADQPRGALQLGRVACHRAGAVGFEQPHAGRPEARHRVRPPHRPQLARRQRCRQALGVAVAAAAHALDDGVDAVAVAFGIGQPLQRHHRDAFADDDAVARGVEGVAAAARRQRLRLAEAQVAERALHRVDTAGEHDVAASGGQLGDGLVDSRQRRAAGRVGREVHAAEVQPVGDAPGDHVEQDAGEGVFGPLGQAVGHVGRQRALETRQLRTQPVLRAHVAGAAAGADDHRGPFAVEGPALVAGIGQRAARHFQRHQLHRVHGLDALGRHAELRGVEGEVVEEAAPLRVDLVLGVAVGVEVQPPVPAVRRDLGDRVDLVEDVLPVGLRRARLGQQRRHADDRDVHRPLARHGRRRLQRGPVLGQQRGRACGDLGVQPFDAGDLVAQRRHLAQHVHAVGVLARFVQRRQRTVLAHARRAFRGDAQPAHDQVVEHAPALVAGHLLRAQFVALAEELLRKRRVAAAAGMAGARFEVHRALAGDDLLLEARHDGARGDDLLGEQIGAAHQDADLHAARGQRCHQHLHQRRRHGVVDAAGEQQLQLARGHLLRVELLDELVDHGRPQHEARQRPDVAAAFAAFEDEAPRTFLHEQRDQVGRGHVQERRHARGFELHGLVGPAAGDDGVAGLVLGGQCQLLVQQRLRREAQQADAPGLAAEQRGGLGQQRVERLALQQREGHHRQRTARGHRIGELGHVGHARHRALHDREAQPQRLRQRRPFGHRRLRRHLRDVRGDGFVDGRQHRRQVAVALAPGRREADVVAHRQQSGLGLVPADLAGHQRGQRFEAQPVAIDHEGLRHGMAGAVQHTEVLAMLAIAHGHGLVARQAGQQRLCRFGQMRLVQQQHLGVEHATGHAHGMAGGRDGGREAAAQVERQMGAAQPLLQQDEAGVLADEAAGFVALQQQRVDLIVQRGLRPARGQHLGHHGQAGSAQLTHGGQLAIDGRGAQQHPAQALRGEAGQRLHVGGVQRRQLDAEAAAAGPHQGRQARVPGRRRGVELGVEDTDGTGARGRDGEGRAVRAGGREHQFLERVHRRSPPPCRGPTNALRTALPVDHVPCGLDCVCLQSALSQPGCRGSAAIAPMLALARYRVHQLVAKR